MHKQCMFSQRKKENMACFMLENGVAGTRQRESRKEKEIEKEKEKESSEKPTAPLYPLPQEDEHIVSRRLLKNGHPLALQNKIPYMSI